MTNSGQKRWKGLAPPLGLDVVQADDGEWVGIEQRGARRQVTLQPVGGVGADHDGVDVEALGELALPLLAQVGRAQHGHALDFAAVEQLACNQCAFDGLADTDVVGDQQPHGG
jgi:hypothetical protein